MKRDLLSEKADQYAHSVYRLSKKLPRDELYGITSQLRRASLSIPLNIIEGYARQSIKSQIQFLHVAFGSLKESQYLIAFCVEGHFLSKENAEPVIQSGDELARMLWAKTRTLKAKI